MIVALGDLIEDVVVRPTGPIRHATDTDADIARRQGGSAANVCVAAAHLGSPTRLLAQVGDDRAGRSLVAALAADGVDTSMIRFGGVTGTIVVLVDGDGERTMLVDRRSALSLRDPEERWLDSATVLHVPLYSLEHEPIAGSARRTIEAAHRRGLGVSVDVSSVALIDGLGAGSVRDLIEELRPTVVFANADEAERLALSGSAADAITIVKRGAAPAVVYQPGARPVEVAAEPVDSAIDTTGAGDTFAAGFLASEDWIDDPVTACSAGHRAAAELLRARAIC